MDVLPDLVAQKLKTVSSESQVSIYNFLLLAWVIFTAKLFNQNQC